MNDRDESTDVWAEVIAAVEFLRDGLRPGLTVWEVLEEAVRRWLDGDQRAVSAWTDPDRLRSSVESLFRQLGPAGGYGACALSTVLTVGGHEILPVGGHEPARWWPAVLPTGGQWFCPR